jgi:hypothetical protein
LLYLFNIIQSTVARKAVPYFSTLSQNATAFGKRFCFDILDKFFLKHF